MCIEYHDGKCKKTGSCCEIKTCPEEQISKEELVDLINESLTSAGKRTVSPELVQVYTKTLKKQGMAVIGTAKDSNRKRLWYCKGAVNAFLNRDVKKRGFSRTPEIDNTVLSVYNHAETQADKGIRAVADKLNAEYGIKLSHETVRQILNQNGVERMKKPRKAKAECTKSTSELSNNEKIVLQRFNEPLPTEFRSRSGWNANLLSTVLWTERKANISSGEVEDILMKHGLIK